LQGIGIDVPIVLGQNGYFQQTFTTFDNEKIKLINLFSTFEGERVMQPNFGLILTITKNYLFENISETLKENIINDIRNKVNYWLPNIILNSIDVLDLPENQASSAHKIEIVVNFSITSNPTYNETITFLL